MAVKQIAPPAKPKTANFSKSKNSSQGVVEKTNKMVEKGSYVDSNGDKYEVVKVVKVIEQVKVTKAVNPGGGNHKTVSKKNFEINS
ncbi:hypothetical protein V2J09_002090 [Rumex salicifolius]